MCTERNFSDVQSLMTSIMYAMLDSMGEQMDERRRACFLREARLGVLDAARMAEPLESPTRH